MEMANGRDLFYGVVQHYAGNEPRGYSEADTVKVSRTCASTCARTRFDPGALQIMSQILSAIRFLHLRKIVHCDLKVMLPPPPASHCLSRCPASARQRPRHGGGWPGHHQTCRLGLRPGAATHVHAP